VRFHEGGQSTSLQRLCGVVAEACSHGDVGVDEPPGTEDGHRLTCILDEGSETRGGVGTGSGAHSRNVVEFANEGRSRARSRGRVVAVKDIIYSFTPSFMVQHGAAHTALKRGPNRPFSPADQVITQRDDTARADKTPTGWPSERGPCGCRSSSTRRSRSRRAIRWVTSTRRRGGASSRSSRASALIRPRVAHQGAEVRVRSPAGTRPAGGGDERAP
jgi:hypothetical protein